MRAGIAGRIGYGGVVTMPRMVATPGTLAGLGQDAAAGRVVVVTRRRFNPLYPLAGLGDEAAYSAGTADVVDVQQDMGSWLSKALKGGGIVEAVGKVVGGVADTVIPGASGIINAALKQPGTNQVAQPGAQFAPPPPTTSPNPQIVVVQDDKSQELPKWVVPTAIGAGVLLVALVALKGK